jgi:cytidylate kinase
MEWVDGDDAHPIFWLSGPAGTGKSTIAHDIAKTCDSGNVLGASFFFARATLHRDNTAKFILSLAYQLAESVPSV